MKKHLFLNQSFGTVGSPNQTGETLTRENRIGLMSYLRRTLMLLFAVLVMSMANVGTAWGATFVEKWRNGKMESTRAWVANLTLGSNASINSSRLEIASGKTGTFTIAVPTGYSLTSIKFTMYTDDDKVKSFTAANGTVVNTDTKEWTYSPSGTRSTETFSLQSQTNKVQIIPIEVTFTDGVSDTYYESLTPSSVSSTVVTCASSSATSYVSMTTSGSMNNQCISISNNGTLAITATKNIKYILFSWSKYAPSADAKWEPSAGSYSKDSYKWTPANSTTKSVTFTRKESNACEISNIHIVYYADAPCGSTAQAALNLSSSSGTICAGSTTTFTVSGGSGSGALSVSSSDETKATATIDGSTVTVTGVAAGSATITVTKACDATYAEKTATYSATVSAIPTANAGADKTTEPGNGVALAATAAASGCTGAWTIQSGPNTSTAQLSSTTSATATFTPTVAGTYTLRWTVTNTSSSCSAYDEMKVTAAVCSISSCGNATLTYAISGGSSGDHATGGTDLISSATASNTTALGASTTIGYTGISMSNLTKKAAAAISACYPTKPNMSGKIDVYNGAAYSSSNYLQFAFTVKTGYTFTPCDIEFTVQPVDVATNFRWEVTDGTKVYGYGTATDVPKGSDGGASVLTGLTSTAEMAAGTYYIRLYPYVNAASKTFRISNDVILKGTTASAAPSCTAPTAVSVTQTAGSSDMVAGESFTLSAATSTGVEEGASYQWYRNSTEVGTNSPTFTVPSCTKVDAGTYWCKITNPCSSDAHTTNVTGFGIKVWQVLLYESSTWNSYDLTSTGTKTGRMSRQLAPGTYYIKLTHNNGVDFGVNTGATISEISATTPSPWTLYGSQNNIKLTVTTAGEYTFDVNYTSADNPTLSVTYPPSTISSCDKIYFCPTQNSIATGSAKFSIYFFNATTNAWANCYLVSGTEYADDAKYVAFAPSTATGWTGMIVVRDNEYASSFSDIWNQSQDITYNGYNYIVGTGWSDGKFTNNLNSFYSSTTPAMSAASYATTVDGTTNASTNLTGATITYASDDPSVATVNSSGVITGVAAGETTITASVGSCTVGSATITVSKNTPTAYTVSGTTTICSGSTATITLSGSEDGASYQLKKGGVAEGVAKAGTGSSLTWTVSAAGTYTVSAVETAKYLGGDMTGNAVITVKTPVTISWNTAPANGTVGGSMTASVTTNYSDGVAYSVQSATPAGCVTVDASTGVISYVAAGTATIRATVTGAGDYCSSAYVDQAVTVTAAAVQTALVANTLYEVPDMIPSGATLTDDDQFFEGLSANTKFELIGSASGSTTPKANSKSTNDRKIDGITFDDGSMWFKGDAEPSSNIPTKYGLSFIVPEGGGKLYLYFNNTGTSTNIKLAKSGSAGSKPTLTDGFAAVDVTAGTYYLYGTGTTAPYSFYGLKLSSKYSVSITTTNVTKATGDATAVHGKAYTATFTAPVGYTLPSDATVSIGGTPQTKGSGYTWTISDGTATLTVPAAKVTGAISIAVSGVAAESYSITYNCNGAESGCPSNVAAAYTLPSPLPTGMTKDGYDFGGWFTDSECTVAAVAGAALTDDTDLYAKWTVHSASECITIAYFETTSHNNSSNLPDKAGKYIYGYTNSAKTEAYAYTITSSTGDNKGQGTGESDYLRMNYGTTVTIYADNTTTGGTPASFSNVTSVSVDFKMKSSSYYTSFDIYVGSTKIANNVSLEGAAQSAFTTFTYDNLEQLSGTVRIVNKGSGSSNYHFYVDNIVICTASMSSCTTPTLPTATLNDQALCEGADIATWTATPTNASTIAGKGESISYSWKKKGSETVLGTGATFDLGNSATESQAGTYVVTVTVSKAGYTSATVSEEIELSVTDGIEVTGITADKATVYPTNSVTLTATASADAAWQWYTCTNAEGDGAAIISGAESASYTIASAGAAGTYYYKAKATGSCGTGSMVYTLTVSAAAGGDCFHFVSVIPESNINISSGASIVTPTHATTLEGGTMKVGSQQVVITAGYGLKMEGTKTVSITLDAALEAGNVVIVKGTSGTKGYGITINGVNFYDADNKTFDVSYTVSADDGLEGQTALSVSKYSGNSYLQEVKITGCGTACTDPEVTASADNTTACAGSSVTFTATGAHAEATYQWQKLNGTWTNISDETESTYTIASVVAGDAGKYRVIATNDCNRTSNEVTLSVPSAPDFGSTVPASVTVMQTIALSISTVEATDAVNYRWYKSADATWDAGDVEIGTNKELIKAYDGEAIGSSSYYIFCRAQNACGITTSSAIAVNVTAYVEEDCATRGNEGSAEFSFENSGCGQGSYQSANCWTMNSNSKILVYYPPTGKYFKTAKVTIASSSESKASYNWSTNGGTDYTAVSLTVNSTLTERTINLSTHGNVNAFQIGRNFDSKGSSGGTLYVSKICFEYTDACTATTVTPSTSSVNYEMGGAWSNPTFTLAPAAVSGETLTYSSSNEDIASVDDDGTVTFNGEAGTVTITASYAGGTISETEYCASSGSYTITVSCTGGAPKVVASGSVDMSGCNSSVTLLAKTQSDGDFADGTYQWFRNGEEIDGATNSSYTATQAGTYTVERTNTSDCTTPSTNSAVVTSETTEPEVERLVPFQYYHVDKTYSDQMKMRHLFAVKNSGTLDGKHFKMYVSRNGGAATDVTNSAALEVWSSADGRVDTVMVNLNELSGKYSANDELVFTCKAIDCTPAVSDVYKNTITMNVIGATPTLALICSGSSKAGGTRKTGELTVGGDFLTGYNVADLCQQTGNTSFDANTEWGLYTNLKTQYIVTPVNGYAVFNKLNYEPFDILLLTDYPKASKSDAAATILDDMAALCDYRPMLSFKTHMVAKSPSKWAEKGFTTSPVVTKADGRLNLNIVCYAHPMFDGLKSGEDVYEDANNTSAPLVYTMLSGTGYEGSKGMQGFELAAAENFVTIGLTHYNATITTDSPEEGEAEWAPGAEDRMLVTAAERQTNIEARFILFSINCGAQSKLTPKGEEVILACLDYLLKTDPLEVADCSFTFDNGVSNEHDAAWYSEHCNTCTGTKGDGKWTTAANWGPHYRLLPGEFTSVRIKKPVEVNDEHAHVMEVRLIDEGSIDIPAGKALDVKSTIRRQDGTEIYPTEENDIHVGSASTGNGTLIFNNNSGDTKARVDMYSKGFISEGVKNYQYIGTPFSEVNALYNYYGSWIYYWKADGSGWKAVKNGGPMTAWTGYCITQEEPTYHQMSGTLTATGTVDINVPADANMVVGNSWTAPIDINALTTDDLEGLTANIYFFNTGVDKTGEGTTTENATGDARWAGGTYVSVPIHAAPYSGDDHIPSMQGFFVKNTGGSAGTLHLDYERHVRKTTRDNILSGELHAPARRTALSSDEPTVLKIKVSGENYDDKLLLLEREDFTEGFDNGWDGDKWDGNESALYIYTTDNNGTENSVSAIPQLEGTVIGFRAGEDDAYTLNFEYLNSDETLYLYDVENNTYTQIMTGMTYRFFTTDNEKHERFIITRSNGQEVATGVESTSGSLDRSKAKKLLIEDKMFIIVNGMLYDATGKVVK